jgi:hypothetical protein
LKTEPTKILEHRGDEFRFGAAAIEIFVAKDKRATVALGSLLSNPECAGVSQVQETRG